MTAQAAPDTTATIDVDPDAPVLCAVPGGCPRRAVASTRGRVNHDTGGDGHTVCATYLLCTPCAERLRVEFARTIVIAHILGTPQVCREHGGAPWCPVVVLTPLV
jgi:hypothetical protein